MLGTYIQLRSVALAFHTGSHFLLAFNLKRVSIFAGLGVRRLDNQTLWSLGPFQFLVNTQHVYTLKLAWHERPAAAERFDGD